jgi:hypothetical protein
LSRCSRMYLSNPPNFLSNVLRRNGRKLRTSNHHPSPNELEIRRAEFRTWQQRRKRRHRTPAAMKALDLDARLPVTPRERAGVVVERFSDLAIMASSRRVLLDHYSNGSLLCSPSTNVVVALTPFQLEYQSCSFATSSVIPDSPRRALRKLILRTNFTSGVPHHMTTTSVT